MKNQLRQLKIFYIVVLGYVPFIYEVLPKSECNTSGRFLIKFFTVLRNGDREKFPNLNEK